MSLVEHTLFGTRDMVEIAIERVRMFCPPDGVYVAFSGGKDSVVTLDIVKRSGVPYDAHMNMTSVDPPEIVRFVREHYPDVQRHAPELTMWQLIEKKLMPPTRTARYCCTELKERGGSGRMVVTGIRWAESPRRSKRQMVENCRTDTTKRFLHPIIDWSEDMVWEYIRERNLPYPSLYDEGWRRVGCIMCPMGDRKGMERDAARWPKFAEAYKRAIARAWHRRVAQGGKVADNRWKTPEEMYEWWIANTRKDPHEAQECFRFDQFDDE